MDNKEQKIYFHTNTDNGKKPYLTKNKSASKTIFQQKNENFQLKPTVKQMVS